MWRNVPTDPRRCPEIVSEDTRYRRESNPGGFPSFIYPFTVPGFRLDRLISIEKPQQRNNYVFECIFTINICILNDVRWVIITSGSIRARNVLFVCWNRLENRPANDDGIRLARASSKFPKTNNTTNDDSRKPLPSPDRAQTDRQSFWTGFVTNATVDTRATWFRTEHRGLTTCDARRNFRKTIGIDYKRRKSSRTPRPFCCRLSNCFVRQDYSPSTRSGNE